MSRMREPVAEIGAEDYRIVRHTHDIEEAVRLMTAKLVEEIHAECPDPLDAVAVNPGTPRKVWMRICPALPGTQAAYEGWKFQYVDADGPGPGAFPAVVFTA